MSSVKGIENDAIMTGVSGGQVGGALDYQSKGLEFA